MSEALKEAGLRLLTAVTRRARLRGRLRLARAVNPWVMPAGGLVLSSLPGGLIMELDLTDEMQQWLHYLGEYETLEIDFILSRLPADGIFLDVGANVGWHTLHAARHLTAGLVHSFEPVAASLERLRRNIGLNHLSNVRVHPVALSDVEEEAPIRIEPRHSGGATMAPRGGEARVETVRCVPLDDDPEGRSLTRIDVVKLDVEGAEVRALRGMSRTLSRCGLPPVLCEINPTLLGLMDTSAAQLAAEASRLGYEPHRLAGGSRLEPMAQWPAENDHVNIVLSRRTGAAGSSAA